MNNPVIATEDITHRPAQWHIASLAAYVRPEQLEQLKHWLLQHNNLEIEAESAQGKLVIVLESDHEKAIANFLDELREQDGVLNAALVYHEILDEQDLLDEISHEDDTL